jgi:uncharacterized protein YjiS (DUF1127 family)
MTPILNPFSPEDVREVLLRLEEPRFAIYGLAAASLVRGVRSAVAALARRVAAARAAHRFQDELGAMSERELRDIGLTRADLFRLAEIGADATLVRNQPPAPPTPGPANQNFRRAA